VKQASHHVKIKTHSSGCLAIGTWGHASPGKGSQNKASGTVDSTSNDPSEQDRLKNGVPQDMVTTCPFTMGPTFGPTRARTTEAEDNRIGSGEPAG
jgi:hypothetical protein